MPKMKTHSGAKKRFRKTGSGKLMRRQQNSNHILEKKSPKSKRQRRNDEVVSAADAPKVRKQLGI